MTIRCRIILLLLLLVSAGLRAQDSPYLFSHLDISKGLSHNEITCIHKDEKGYLWLGTPSGLNRYDGYSFRVFKKDLRDSNSVISDDITQLLEGPGGRLWIGTSRGFCLYDPRTERFDRHPRRYLQQIHIDTDSVTDIRKDSRGAYWFVTIGDGLYQYYPRSGQTSHYSHRAGVAGSLHADSLSAAAPDGKGGWWLLYRDGWLEKMNDEGLLSMGRRVPGEGSNTSQDYRLYVDGEGDVWFYTPGRQEGVFYYHPESGVCRLFAKDNSRSGLNTNLVTGIVEDDKGYIWIATDHGGINLLDKKDFSVRYLLAREGDDKSLSQNSINCIYKDNSGIVWVGTFKKGANYYHADILSFPLFRHQPADKNSLPYNDVNRFVEDAKGNIWIGTNGGGLLCYNRATGRFSQYVHSASDAGSLSNDVIVSLCIDAAQRLWIGTYYGGLDCFDGHTFHHYRHRDSDSNSIGDDRIWEIREDSRHRLWIGTLAAGLDLFDPATHHFRHFKPGAAGSVRSAYISELMEDRLGNLWVGTATGIDVLEAGSGRFHHYGSDEKDAGSLSSNDVLTIVQDHRGLIWVGTRDGLNLFDTASKTFTSWRIRDGLPDNTILTLLEDNSGNLWASTPNGLANLVIKEDEHHPGHYTFCCRNYNESSGLQGREFNENAALRTREGELLFGGAGGFNWFNPRRLPGGWRSPSLVLTDLQLFNRLVGIGEEINGHVPLPVALTEARGLTLRYNENVFSLGFAALDLLNGEKVQYAYTLEGFNNDWLVSDDHTRKAVYTNLDPGHYVFKVRTATEDGHWNEPMLSLPITILPPFWKTPLAYGVYILLLAGILFLARRMVLARAHMRFALAQQQQEAQRLQELDRMKTRFFTNMSHEFRTPLSLILTPLEKIIGNTEDARSQQQFQLIHRNARRLLHMVNQLLDFRKLELQELRLHAQPADLIRFIKELSFSFSDMAGKKHIDFTFQSEVNSLVLPFDADKLERILFNLLSNAFKFTPEYGSIRVEIKFSASPASIALIVKDTGIGITKDKQEKIFERYFQNEVPDSMLNQGSGIGLAITKEFVRLHQWTIEVDSEPGKGSCFTVGIPVPAAASLAAAAEGASSPAAAEDMALRAMEDRSLAEAAKGVAPKAAGMGADRTGRAGGKKPRILLVEDNEDFRFYLKDNLKEYFTILEAGNGHEGWRLALSEHPDGVVSDISMPGMNGIDLCRKIKGDSRTALIPVILLTALIGEAQQLEGLETGANDYLTKPFNFEILLSRIRNQLAQQSKAKKAWQRQLKTHPEESQAESPDEKFLRMAVKLIEKNIANTDFSVEEMSRSLYISRVALYKKILALTGKTPIEYIRCMRLQRAAQLLEKSRFTIAEIAYETGFNNPKTFSKYFKEMYGLLPSAYQRVNRPVE